MEAGALRIALVEKDALLIRLTEMAQRLRGEAAAAARDAAAAREAVSAAGSGDGGLLLQSRGAAANSALIAAVVDGAAAAEARAEARAAAPPAARPRALRVRSAGTRGGGGAAAAAPAFANCSLEGLSVDADAPLAARLRSASPPPAAARPSSLGPRRARPQTSVPARRAAETEHLVPLAEPVTAQRPTTTAAVDASSGLIGAAHRAWRARTPGGGEMGADPHAAARRVAPRPKSSSTMRVPAQRAGAQITFGALFPVLIR